ncbi:MAG: GspH/FimT family pseudopilin [Dethiobacteria bacterium]|jgi:type II secretory pathway pseudopilin PulG
MKVLKSLEEGFTIVELVTVLGILTIMAAMILPLAPLLSRYNLDGAARGLVGDLRMVRQKAINTGIAGSVNFRINEDRYQVRPPEESRYFVNLPQGVHFEGVTTFPGSPPSISFNKMGRPSSGGTVVLKSSAGEMRFVIVLPVTGRIRISRDPPQNW